MSGRLFGAFGWCEKDVDVLRVVRFCPLYMARDCGLSGSLTEDGWRYASMYFSCVLAGPGTDGLHALVVKVIYGGTASLLSSAHKDGEIRTEWLACWGGWTLAGRYGLID